MNFLVRRLLCQHGSKGLKRCTNNFIRLTSNDGPVCGGSTSKPEPCTGPKSDPNPPLKPDCNAPKVEPVKSECGSAMGASTCSDPCQESPPSCQTICPQNADPNNPCNYTPPADLDEPDLTRIKKKQCKFQEDNGLPVYLKGGKFDNLLYQATAVLVIFNFLLVVYMSFRKP